MKNKDKTASRKFKLISMGFGAPVFPILSFAVVEGSSMGGVMMLAYWVLLVTGLFVRQP